MNKSRQMIFSESGIEFHTRQVRCCDITVVYLTNMQCFRISLEKRNSLGVKATYAQRLHDKLWQQVRGISWMQISWATDTEFERANGSRRCPSVDKGL